MFIPALAGVVVAALIVPSPLSGKTFITINAQVTGTF
jgi:hypothetical protein